MFIFWHRFVLPDLSRITMGLGETVCGEVFAGPLQSHMGYAFEQCARQNMWRALKAQRSPVSFQKIGRWWGANPKERREEELDFIAFSKETALFGVTCGLLGLSWNFASFLVFLGVAELFWPVLSAAYTVFVQETVPAEVLGRVFPVIQIIMTGTVPIAILFFGLLADVVQIETIC